MDTLEEINSTTHDEYGMKAAGFLQSLEKFNTLFGLRLAHILFLCCRTSFFRPSEDALSAVGAAKAYYHRLRSEEEFDHFLMQQSNLQISITLESQKHQDTSDDHHDLKMEVDLMSFHLLEPTIARLSLKLVIFYLWS